MKKSVDYLIFLLFKLIQGIIFLLPRRFCLALGRLLGFFFYVCDRRHRHIALSNLSLSLGNDHSLKSLKSLARGSFSHFGEVILDLIKFSTLKEHKKALLIDVDGAEYIQNALLEKKGALLFTAHFGNWEIAPYYVSQLGALKVMARPLDNVFLEKELLKMRLDLGEDVILQTIKPHARFSGPSVRMRWWPSSSIRTSWTVRLFLSIFLRRQRGRPQAWPPFTSEPRPQLSRFFLLPHRHIRFTSKSSLQ